MDLWNTAYRSSTSTTSLPSNTKQLAPPTDVMESEGQAGSDLGSEFLLAPHESSTTSTKSMVPEVKHNAPKYVEWGANWKPPGLILSTLFFGIAFSITHHIHFRSLDGTPVGEKLPQQWSTFFGTGYAFLVIALLRTACTEAYQQYIWMVVKRTPFELTTLDKLFALTSNPMGFWNVRVLKSARVAIFIALICW